MNSRQKTRFIQGLILTLVIWSLYFILASSSTIDQFLAKASNQRGDIAFFMVVLVGLVKYVLLITGISLPLALVVFRRKGK